MTCKYCDSAECLAYATVVDDGFVFPALLGGKRHDAQAACRKRTLQRALRAEAELLAACGDLSALTPFLGDWEFDPSTVTPRLALRRNEDIVAVVRCGSRGAWGWCKTIGEIFPDHRGVLSVMAQCERALAEAQEGKR